MHTSSKNSFGSYTQAAHLFEYGYLIVSPPFVEKMILSPNDFVRNELTVA